MKSRLYCLRWASGRGQALQALAGPSAHLTLFPPSSSKSAADTGPALPSTPQGSPKSGPGGTAGLDVKGSAPPLVQGSTTHPVYPPGTVPSHRTPTAGRVCTCTGTLPDTARTCTFGPSVGDPRGR